MALKIKKGDKVVVLSGKDKGRHGEVVKSMPKEGKVIVSGINVEGRARGSEDGQAHSGPLRGPRWKEGPGCSPVRGADQWLTPNILRA